MHSLLTKLFAKRGIKDTTELSSEEKRDFDNWQKILSKEELTIDDIRIFCQTQVRVIENQWTKLDTDQSKKAELIPYHTVYKTLLVALDSPKVAREGLEKQLIQMIETYAK